MEVIIKEKKYDYISDYPNGWQFSSGDYFKFSVPIGNHKCFIKRFDYINQQNISGWELLTRLRHKYEPCLPKIYDIVSVEEKKKKVHYVFYEHLKGTTLNLRFLPGKAFDLARLTNDLFSAVESIYKYEYWFADFCEKNIFCEDRGRFLLLDLDSTQPLSKAPNNEMYGNKDYWVLVFNFYKDIINYKNIKLNDISGISLNHLQIVFLILNLKLSLQDPQLDYNSSDVFNNLPACLNNIDPAFKKLFIKVHDDAKLPRHSYSVEEIKNLIIEKIIFPTVIYPAPPITISSEDFEQSDFVLMEEETVTASNYENDADIGEPYLNEAELEIPEAEEETITVPEEPVDEEDKESEELWVDENENVLADENTTVLADDNEDQNKSLFVAVSQPTGVSKGRYIVMAILTAIIAGAGFFYFYQPEHQIELIRFYSAKVIEGQNLLLTGKNFPKKPNQLQVLFNDIPGTINYNSDSVLSVRVPILGEHLGNGNVNVVLINKKDTFHIKSSLLVEKTRRQ